MIAPWYSTRMSHAGTISRNWTQWLRLSALAGLSVVLALVFTHFKAQPEPAEPFSHVEPKAQFLELQHWSDDKVYVAPHGTRIYAPALGGGIEAINIFTGERLWHSPAASSVVGTSKGLVVAWTAVPPALQRNGSWKQNDLRVVVLNAATGEIVLTTDPVSLPDWAIPVCHISNGGHRFRANAEIEGDEVQFHWKADMWYSGGPPPPPDIKQESTKKAVGSFSINLLSAKVGLANWKLNNDSEPPFESRDSVNVGDLTILQLGGDRNEGFNSNRTLQVSRAGVTAWRREIATMRFIPDPP